MIVSKQKAEALLDKKLSSLGKNRRSYYVLSEDGARNLGGPYTKEQAKKRLQQVEYFKRKKNPEKYCLKLPSSNPKSFWDKDHNWSEVLIDKDGKSLTRKQILDYYKKNEKKIWPFLKNQTVIVYQAPSKNNFIIRRKRDSDDKYIRLNKLYGIDDEGSFEYWIYRRAIEFHPVLTGSMTPLIWLDLDVHKASVSQKRGLRKKMKSAIPKIKKAMRKVGAQKLYVYDSGMDGGIHIEGPLKKPKNVDNLRKALKKELDKAFKNDSDFTTSIADSDQIRLDYTTLHKLGSLRSPYSMTIKGGVKERL